MENAILEKQYTGTVSSVRQITLPKQMCEELGWRPGDTLVWSVNNNDGKVTLSKEKSLRDDLKEWRDNLPEQVKHNIRKVAGWTISQYHEHFDSLPEAKEHARKRYGIKYD